MFESILSPILNAYDVVFAPLLGFGTVTQGAMLSVFVLAFIFSISVSLLYKLLMDTDEFQRVKDKMKDLQKKSKEAQKEGNHDEAMKLMSQSTKHQMEFMKIQMKPMLATLVIAFLLFPWLGHAFEPSFELTQQGEVYKGNFDYRSIEKPIELSDSNSTLIKIGDKEIKSKSGYVEFEGSKWQVNNMNINEEEEKASLGMKLVFISLPFSLPFIGASLESIGFYFIILLPLSTGFRKLMGVQ